MNAANMISCARITLSCLLLFLGKKPLLFVFVYMVCGFTDVADGFIARKYDMVTRLGEKLDSAGDICFFAVAVYIFCSLIEKQNQGMFVAVALLVMGMRVMNFIVAAYKFGQYTAMRTIANDIAMAADFLLAPISVLAHRVPVWMVIIAGSVHLFSALEECIILLVSSRYDLYRPGFFDGRKIK